MFCPVAIYFAISDDDRDDSDGDGRAAVAARVRVSAMQLRQAHAARRDESGATVATSNYRKRTAVKSARDGDASGARASETGEQRRVRTTRAAADTPGACTHDIAGSEVRDAVGGERGTEVSTPVATGPDTRDDECGRHVNMYGTGVNPSTVTHAFTLADPTLAWLILNGVMYASSPGNSGRKSSSEDVWTVCIPASLIGDVSCATRAEMRASATTARRKAHAGRLSLPTPKCSFTVQRLADLADLAETFHRDP